MSYELFVCRLPQQGRDSLDELNGFLASHRIVSVEKSIQVSGGAPCWAFLVEYVPGTGGSSVSRSHGLAGGEPRDYREILSPEDFAVYCRLRNERRRLAEADGVQAYVIFTNEQLAEMVTGRVRSLAAMGKIRNVGEKRLEKYGPRMLAVLQREMAEQGPSPPADAGKPPDAGRPAREEADS